MCTEWGIVTAGVVVVAGGRYADELCVDISLLWRGYVTDAYLGGGNMSGPGGGLIMSALVALHCYGGGGWLGCLGWL